jgi:hypothetical protein
MCHMRDMETNTDFVPRGAQMPLCEDLRKRVTAAAPRQVKTSLDDEVRQTRRPSAPLRPSAH